MIALFCVQANSSNVIVPLMIALFRVELNSRKVIVVFIISLFRVQAHSCNMMFFTEKVWEVFSLLNVVRNFVGLMIFFISC